MTKKYTSFDDYIAIEPCLQESRAQATQFTLIDCYLIECYGQLKYQEGLEDAKQAALNTFKS